MRGKETTRSQLDWSRRIAGFVGALALIGSHASAATLGTFTGTLAEIPNPERGLSRIISENLSDVWEAGLVTHRDAGYRLVSHREVLAPYVNTPTLPPIALG